MDFHVYVHVVNEPECATRERLDQILAQVKKLGVSIMSVADQVKKLAADLDAETNAIQARIDALIAKLGDTVDPADLATLQAISDRLAVLGQDPANPIPPNP